MTLVYVVETSRFSATLRLEVVVTIHPHLLQCGTFTRSLWRKHRPSRVIDSLDSRKPFACVLLESAFLEELSILGCPFFLGIPEEVVSAPAYV